MTARLRIVDPHHLTPEPEPQGECCCCDTRVLLDSPGSLCGDCATVAEKFIEIVSRLFKQRLGWDPADPDERCDSTCPSWGVFGSAGGKDVERCDDCCYGLPYPLFECDEDAAEIVAFCVREAMRLSEIIEPPLEMPTDPRARRRDRAPLPARRRDGPS